MKKKLTKTQAKTKDELEYATNWSRVFADIYQHLKWLNAYAEINEISMKKILKKFMKIHFEDKNNKLQEDIIKFIRSRQISHRTQLQVALTSVLEFFLVYITNGNESKARQILEKQKYEVRRSDAIQLWSLFSASCVMSLFAIMFNFFKPPSDDQELPYDYFKPIDLMFRLSFIITYILAACGFCIQWYNHFGVNYLYIFECDPNIKMTHYQMYRLALLVFLVQMSCLTFTLAQIKFFE